MVAERVRFAMLVACWSWFGSWSWFVSWFFARFLKNSSSLRRAELVGVPLSSPRNGAVGLGFFNSWIRSSTAAVARSADDVSGILNVVGKRTTVSEFLRVLVEVTKML